MRCSSAFFCCHFSNPWMYQAPRIVSFPVRFALTGFLFYFSAWLWVWKCLNSCPPLFTNKVPTALGQVLIFKTGERFHAFPIYSGNCQSHLGDCSNKKIKVHYGNKESPLLFSTAGQIHVHTLHPPPPLPPFLLRTRNIHFATPSSWSEKKGRRRYHRILPRKKLRPINSK